MQTSTQWQQLQPSYIREILAASQQPGIISLAGGLPASELLPTEQLRPYIEALTQQAGLFQYGSSAGLDELRDYLKHLYRVRDDGDLIITSGSQQGLDIITRTFVDKDTAIALEAPCYLGALQVFQLSGAEICPVTQTPAGPDLIQLEEIFRRRSIRIFYAVPDFHNPTGVCWSLETRHAVISLCRRYGVYLLEDAPYRELRFHGQALATLAELAPERTLQLRSFSKTVAPGIRLGALTGPTGLIRALLRTRQAMDLHSPVPFQKVLADFLQSPDYSRHLEQLRLAYAERYALLSGQLRRQLGQQVSFNAVDGGMFLWLKIPLDSEQFARRALANGVATVPGCHFFPSTTEPVSGQRLFLRLNFSHPPAGELATAVDRISRSF